MLFRFLLTEKSNEPCPRPKENLICHIEVIYQRYQKEYGKYSRVPAFLFPNQLHGDANENDAGYGRQ